MPDFKDSSESAWLLQLKQGDSDSLAEVWKRFHDQLTLAAQARLESVPQSTADADDIVVSVFESVWRASKAGRLQSLQNCDELLWWLLKTVHRKSVDHVRRESAQKRSNGVPPGSLDETVIQPIDGSPSSEYLAILKEQYEQALNVLPDQLLRQIAVLRMEGYTNVEICELLDVAPATVTRKARRIRAIWDDEFPANSDQLEI